MRSLLTSLVIAVALFVGVTSANATTTWYWNTAKANYVILDEGLQYSDGFAEVYVAHCYPYGRWIPARDGKQRLWQHFNCHVMTFDDDNYWIKLHVTGKYTWRFVFWKWA